MKVPRSREQAELEKVPRSEKPEIEELIFKAIISQEHEEACCFWRGDCRDKVDYSTGSITMPKRRRSGHYHSCLTLVVTKGGVIGVDCACRGLERGPGPPVRVPVCAPARAS